MMGERGGIFVSEPPQFGQPHTSPPEISSDFDGHCLTFRPLARAGLIAALLPLFTLFSDQLGGLGLLLLMVCMAALLWLGFAGYEEHMRVTGSGVRLESRFAGWTVRSAALRFADIKAVVVDDERGGVLRFSRRDGTSKTARLGTHDDHVKLAAWLTGIVESRSGVDEGSRADVPESLRRLAQVART